MRLGSPQRALLALSFAALTIIAACSRDEPGPVNEAPRSITNRLAVSPEVVANLGITFAEATRGRVGSWLSVPGELDVPGTHRWSLRAPAHGRLIAVAARWREIEAGDIVAELESPTLREAQQDLFAAQSHHAHSRKATEAAHARLDEGETYVRAARVLESASLERLEHLSGLGADANAFATRELLDARRAHVEAQKAALEAAVRRDELWDTARQKELAEAQARLGVERSFSALSLLSGRTREELRELEDGTERWKAIESIVVRAPASGVVVDVFVSRGEALAEGDPVAVVLDPSELRFRGWLPEGDLPSLRSGAPVRVDLPGRDASVSTELLGPMPVADAATRRVLVEAAVANPDRTLPQGLSATAHVQVSESAHEEVLLPEDCVVSDGLEMIVFRRDPSDPGVVTRTPVELGLQGAGIVEVLSGVMAGDFVVRKGIHQLKRTGLGKAPPGGHFHADGTWHRDHE